MTKQFTLYSLAVSLSAISPLAALAYHHPYQNQVNTHLSEANHEFFDDKVFHKQQKK